MHYSIIVLPPGLNARLAIAQANGVVTPAGLPVANAEELKTAIALSMCTPPHNGSDLGNHHDLIQFLPAHYLHGKLNSLCMDWPWLRHGGGGVGGVGAGAWPDVVDYCQVITITRANAAVGPVDTPIYFNL